MPNKSEKPNNPSANKSSKPSTHSSGTSGSSSGAISPTREQNYPEWYQEVVRAAELAENSPVRGCMVIRPWGYALWENMQAALDAQIKATGHVNAYFPLLIPLSFLEKEAAHVEGFAKECAVVTHHRLKTGPDGRLHPDPESLLEEPHIVRPTSETIIGHMYAKWVQSYRDLPILMNQWCNVMRWEMRTRLFLRTSEFLWQEGHTVHATAEEAMEETLKMLDVYTEFAEQILAVPVVPGRKTPDERFPGAVETYSIEAMMQDRKALQAGTSHFLGQNFAQASDIKFLNSAGEQQHAWTTSWGVSTRLIGGLIMTHSDDDGLVLPPRIAPHQVVILPIYRDEQERSSVMQACAKLKMQLESIQWEKKDLRVHIDARDMRGGDKYWQAVKKGVPVRIEIGPRDIAKNQVALSRRDHGPKEKEFIQQDEVLAKLPPLLLEIQNNLLQKAKSFQKENTQEIKTLGDLRDFFEKGPGGFAVVPWHEAAMGHELLAELKLSPRCQVNSLNDAEKSTPKAPCVFSGQPTQKRVIIAASY